MELKTILAIGLVVFIVGALIFLKIRAKKKQALGQRNPLPLYISRKQKRRQKSWFISLMRT